MMLMQFTIAKY